jgi:hypothetical protein
MKPLLLTEAEIRRCVSLDRRSQPGICLPSTSRALALSAQGIDAWEICASSNGGIVARRTQARPPATVQCEGDALSVAEHMSVPLTLTKRGALIYGYKGLASRASGSAPRPLAAP